MSNDPSGGHSYEQLVHPWGDPVVPPTFRGVVDETIRDGLQMPYAPSLSIASKCRLIDHMTKVGIPDVIVGMIHKREADAEILALLRHCEQSGSGLQPWVLSRLNLSDLERLARLRDAVNLDLGANIFVCVSPLRRFVEDWAEGQLLEDLDDALAFVSRYFSQIRVALEDATRTPSESLAAVSRVVARRRATRFVLADTAGVATPEGVRRIFDFVNGHCPWLRDAGVALEWHGHNDRGVAVANSLESIACGAHYVHGTILGIGERNGNAALDTILLNLSTAICGVSWEGLRAYQLEAQELFGHYLANLYPFFGDFTFATATGTHCAAAQKALARGRPDLAVLLFSPPSAFSKGARLRFLLSPISGRASAIALLDELGVTPTPWLVQELLARVQKFNSTIGTTELAEMLETIQPDASGRRTE